MKKLLILAALMILPAAFGQDPETETETAVKTISGYLNLASLKGTTFLLDVPGKGSVAVDFAGAEVTRFGKIADLSALPNRSTLKVIGTSKNKSFSAEKVLVTFVRSKLVRPAGTKPVTTRADDPKPRGKTTPRKRRR